MAGRRAAEPGRPKLAIIGLDCAEPSLVFEKWWDDLPVLRSLAETGVWGRLTTTVPPITCPAWTAMASGRDPGELGIYGFRNRRSGLYADVGIALSDAVTVPLLWDRLGAAGFDSLVLGVPQTYPPRPLRGALVTCFLTPGADVAFTYPAELKTEVLQVVPDYQFDVPEFRTEDKARLLSDLRHITAGHFRLARHFARTRAWDFLMMVEIGVDRVHHGFWQYMDPAHALHEPGSPYASAIFDYYRLIDRELGRLLRLLPKGALVMVVSDHGAQAMEGGFAINEWLRAEGYLRLREVPRPPAPVDKAAVDWTKTTAWGYGGYYGRLCLNLKGREPEGIVEPADADRVLDEIAAKLEAICLPDGRPMGNRTFRPRQIYREVRNLPPDLMIYFGDLRWRSQGTVGGGQIFTLANDTGPDGANHAQEGLYILTSLDKARAVSRAGPARPGPTRGYLDIAPTVLRHFDLAIPAELRGHPIHERQ